MPTVAGYFAVPSGNSAAVFKFEGHLATTAIAGRAAQAQAEDWLENEAQRYFQETGARRFKLHNLRGTAMSRARRAGISIDDAAIAFGCNPDTMRKHYVAIDEESVADSVMAAI